MKLHAIRDMAKKCIQTPYKYIITLFIRNGLLFMDMIPLRTNKTNSYPHVIFTPDLSWDPQILHDEMNANLIVIEDDDDTYAYYHSDSNNGYGELIFYASNKQMSQPNHWASID
jgi:hypothetical protein